MHHALTTGTAVMLGAATVLLWLPLVSELLCLLRRRPFRMPGPPPQSLPRLLILVPAHNEELLIGDCAGSLARMEYPADRRRIVVVADNCTDRTATLARAQGLECIERSDLGRPGKPQALVWAMGELGLAGFDALVIVDADSVVAPGFARALAAYAPLDGIVLQANFLVSNEWESWLTRLGGVLSRIRYEISYPLKGRAGINCPMTGNGMCIGTSVLRSEGWNAFSITEDSELFAQYTAAGIPILHASGADLFSQEVTSLAQGTTQRRRWLAGRIAVVRVWGPKLLWSRRIDWHQKLDAFVELVLASPVLHLLSATAVGALALLLPIPGGRVIASLALGSLTGLLLATVVVLARHPQPMATLLAFLRLPVYAGWRLILVLRTILSLGDRRWQRTSRTTPLG